MKTRFKLLALFVGLAMLWVSSAWAQTPPTPQFAFLGFIQEATLDTGFTICTPPNDPVTLLPSPRLAGGTITVNGIKMIVPCNSIIQFPAATFTWADMFDPVVSAPVGTYIGTPNPYNPLAPPFPVPANPPVGSTVAKTGLALTDGPMPFPSFEVSVNGNVVNGQYIVGLIVPITQQGLNGSSGLVSFIDYTSGSFRVGGIVGDPNCTQGGVPGGGPLCSGALVQFNDPGVVVDPILGTRDGRWGLSHSIDPRFAADSENVTIHTSTGFPLCIPRFDPAGLTDPKCPLTQRPANGAAGFPPDPFLAPGAPLKIFDMPAPVLSTKTVQIDPLCVPDPTAVPPVVCPTQIVYVIDPATGEPTNTVTPDALKQIPLMVGDQVVYAGTLYRINPLATKPVIDPITGLQATDPVTGALLTMPDNSAANSYISAHTVEDVLGVFTAPGVPPAYVYIEALLIGTNGAAVQGILQEASTRMTVVGFTSDPTRLVDIYAIDVNPCSGQETLRLLASEDPAVDAIRGRFVHRVLGGLFMPPTRMYDIKSRTQALDLNTGLPVPLIAANGIATGQFALPNFEYIFPENHRLGDPFIPNNYQDLPFLAFGSGPVNTLAQFGDPIPIPGRKTGDPTSPKLGQLNPWPGSPVPTAPICPAGGGTAPIVTIDPPTISVGLGAAVTLIGAVTFDPTDDAATRTSVWTGPVVGTQGGSLTAPTYTFTAPNTPGVLTFTLTATDNFGTTPGFMNVNVLAASDIVQIPQGLCTLVIARKIGKRGGFGKFNCTAVSSDVTATLTLTSISDDVANGQPTCPLLTPVPGGTCNWGTGTTKGDGIYNWVEIKGFPDPLSITVTSDKGGSATALCSPPDARGRVSCP